MNYRNPQRRVALAEEYVLGTMTGHTRRRFQRLMETDPALRGEVEACEQALYPFVDALPERAPPASVWESVNRRLDADAIPATAAAPVARRHAMWRSVAIAASAALLAIGLYLTVAPTVPPPGFVVVVTSDEASRASWVLTGSRESGVLRVRTVAPQSLPSDKGFQLWVLPSGEDRVRPVGMLPASGEARLDVAPALLTILPAAQKFGVSIEEPGGSPTGQPTTTPLYHGTPMAL